MIEAYITNLGKYNEGELKGEFLKFPTTTEDVQALLARIGVDGSRYEEYIITEYETDVEGLSSCLNEYESIDELNYLAALLEELNENEELEKFEAALVLGEYCGSVRELINLTQNLECFEFYPDVANEEDLGRYYVDELDALQIPDNLEPYFDYEAYGRDIALESISDFVNGGFIVGDTRGFTEYYTGKEDLPDEHLVFAYPEKEKRSILKTLKQHREAPSPVQARGGREVSQDER